MSGCHKNAPADPADGHQIRSMNVDLFGLLVAGLPPFAVAMPGCSQRSPVADRGAGLFGMMMGLTVFLLLLTVAVQVLFNLYATTLVTGAAFDAAQVVAGYNSVRHRCNQHNRATAEATFWRSLGGYRQRGTAALTWDCSDTETVKLTVVAQHPTILPPMMQNLTGLGHLNRTIEVRVEDKT